MSFTSFQGSSVCYNSMTGILSCIVPITIIVTKFFSIFDTSSLKMRLKDLVLQGMKIPPLSPLPPPAYFRAQIWSNISGDNTGWGRCSQSRCWNISGLGSNIIVLD